jgi:uncharacterized protein YjeT (DUF2065 family)
MNRNLSGVALLCVLCLCGCGESAPARRLRLTNEALQQQVQSQDRMLRTMGFAVVILGGALAVAVGLLWRQGGGGPSTRTERE